MFEIVMPQAGQSMEDGTIVRWRKAQGDTVAVGDVLLEIETDKATIEVESAHSGVLRKILHAEGATVPVLTVIGLIGEADEDISLALGKVDSAGRSTGPPEPSESPTAPAEKPAAGPARPGGTVIPILMPKAGQSMEEGTIVSWHVKPGQSVSRGDVIFEVETDKAVVEVEAVDAGTLATITVHEGQTAEVLKPVAYLADSQADVEAYLAGEGAGADEAPQSPDEAPAKATAGPSDPAERRAVAPAEGGRVKASPAARRLARDRGVDLASIATGSGPGGRIISSDVPAAGAPEGAVTGRHVRRPMSSMRRAIARNLQASKQSIPHFYARLTVDAEKLFAFYRAQKAKFPCTLNDVVTLACARVIREMPAFRSRLDKDEIVEFAAVNIGIAVGVPDGLVVPVVLGADGMTLQQLASETARIVAAARSGKVEGSGRGVFTITNMGMFGVEEFSAIINPPEAAILAVGALREAPVVRNGSLEPARVMSVTLSADHRLIDGMMAAQFLAKLRELLEGPDGLL